MAKTGPIIIVEDDSDDCELLQDVIRDLKLNNEIKCFSTGFKALEYFLATTDTPFLIFSDINMPVMDGLELRRLINENEKLKRHSIPFIYFTTAATSEAVSEAYYLSVQGFFEKPHSYDETINLLKHIIDYWSFCRHPNNLHKFKKL